MKPIIVLNGIHASGKTTLGRSVARILGGEFFPEIGGRLRSQVGYNCLESGELFDRQVMDSEFMRDEELLACSLLPIVETWHTGNLAYVMQRSPQLAGEYLNRMMEQLKSFDPTAILIRISRQSFIKRATERVKPSKIDELVNFYQKVESFLLGIYKMAGIDYLIIENESDPERVAKELAIRVLDRVKVRNLTSSS